MFPRLFELILEHGAVAGMLGFLQAVVSCMLIFTFINKSIASGVKETIVSGEADYIATGRPDANTHYSWLECYRVHVKSHFYSALKVCLFYLLYKMITADYHEGSLPMVLIMASCLMWIVAPIIYCPQPTWKTLWADVREYQMFVIDTPDVLSLGNDNVPLDKVIPAPAKASSLLEFWLHAELKSKHSGFLGQLCVLCFAGFKLFGMMAVTYSSMMDNIWNMCVLLAFHWFFIFLQHSTLTFQNSTLIQFLELLMWSIVPLALWGSQEGYTNILMTGIVLVLALDFLSEVLKLILWCWYCPRGYEYDKAKDTIAYLPEECLEQKKEDRTRWVLKKYHEVEKGVKFDNTRTKYDEEHIFFQTKTTKASPKKTEGFLLPWQDTEWHGEKEEGEDWVKVTIPGKDKAQTGRKIRKYDTCVYHLYLSCLSHQLHIYAAFLLGLMFLITQIVCILLDDLCGLHTSYVLNSELRKDSSGICSRRQGTGYTPGDSPSQSTRTSAGNAQAHQSRGVQPLLLHQIDATKLKELRKDIAEELQSRGEMEVEGPAV